MTNPTESQPNPLDEVIRKVWHDGYDAVHMILPKEEHIAEARTQILALMESVVEKDAPLAYLRVELPQSELTECQVSGIDKGTMQGIVFRTQQNLRIAQREQLKRWKS